MTRKALPLPSQCELHQIFEYCAETGVLRWKPRPDNPRWNRVFANKPAGGIDGKGYVRIRTEGKIWNAHRVIWKMVYGEDPDFIDHINGDRSDNRIDNLRSVTQVENARNTKLHKSNASGASGVHWVSRDRRWCASIHSGGKKIALGHYVDKADAVLARQRAEKEYGYHPNHGRCDKCP